jgi:hypothetical protein
MRLLTLAALVMGCGAVCAQQVAPGGEAAKPDQASSGSVAADGQVVAPAKTAVVASPGEKLDPQDRKSVV